jgi:hypothetical protein
MTRRIVIIESPYYNNPDACRYLACCGLDCIDRGEVPLASHAFLPLCLPEHVIVDGTEKTGREIGLECGEAMATLCQPCEAPELAQHGTAFALKISRVFYTDLGWSDGMRGAYGVCDYNACNFSVRALQGPAREIWESGEWPTMARLTPNHEVKP